MDIILYSVLKNLQDFPIFREKVNILINVCEYFKSLPVAVINSKQQQAKNSSLLHDYV